MAAHAKPMKETVRLTVNAMWKSAKTTSVRQSRLR